MGVFGWWQWLIVLVIVLLLFGRGKIPELMGDVAKGIKNFRSGLSDDSDAKEDGAKTVEHKTEEAVDTAATAKKKS